MVDLEGKDKGNISLPPRLQSPDVFDPDFVDDENVVPIINLQKALYDIRISDTEKRIQRHENRIDELLDNYEDTEILVNDVDIATGDHIAYLKKQISVETEKIEETRQKLDTCKTLREEAKEVHMRNVDAANEKYENTRVALTSSIKALNAKINTLEDYKECRGALRDKLKNQDETMTRNEEEIMQKRDEIDRKFKIDREKLKNEMYSRLLALAGTCQIEISNAISIPVHRLMRENIVMKNEMLQIVNDTLKRKEVYSRTRSMESVRCQSIKSDKRERTRNLITAKIQRSLLNALREMHSAMKKRLANHKTPKEFAQEKYDILADGAKNECMASEARTRKLEVVLHRENVKLDRAQHLKNQSESRFKKYEEIIYDVKYAVACALKMTETGQDFLNMSEVELISHLISLIFRRESDIRCLVAASSESIPRPENVYVKGDLGFEPEHVDLESLRSPKKSDTSISPETVTIDVPTPSAVLPSALSLQSDDSEFEKIRRQMMISIEESSETSVTSPVAGSKDGSSEEVHEDISEAGDTLENDVLSIENEESFSSESGENGNA